MNKLYRYILVGIFALIPCFSNAETGNTLRGTNATNAIDTVYITQNDTININSSNQTNYWNNTNSDVIVCVYDTSDANDIEGAYGGGVFSMSRGAGRSFCYLMTASNSDWYSWTKSNGTYRVSFTVLNTNYCQSNNLCPVMTSLECQTEYNLIPLSEVTANYCKLNYDLIEPANCPINEGTGAIVRSNLTINNTPYAQNQNINVYIPDFLAWNVAFNDFNTVIDIEGYNADEDYINNVIDQEKLTPTNEDFTNMILALTGFIPYLFIALLFFWIVRIINRIWR